MRKKLIDKDALVAEIKTRIETYNKGYANGDDCRADALETFLHDIDFLEVKDINLIINTIIAECCDWLAICTDLDHNLIEDCRNLMLAIKDEQFKTRKGE